MYYCSTMLTETMCPSRSICQRAPEGVDVCLFISLGDLSMQSPFTHTVTAAEVSGSASNGCLATSWCHCSRYHPSRIVPWDLCTWTESLVRGQPHLLCWDASAEPTVCSSFSTRRPVWFICVESRPVHPSGQVGRRN